MPTPREIIQEVVGRTTKTLYEGESNEDTWGINKALKDLAKFVRGKKRSYKMTYNPLRNGQSCRAYRQKLRNEAFEEIAKEIEK